MMTGPTTAFMMPGNDFNLSLCGLQCVFSFNHKVSQLPIQENRDKKIWGNQIVIAIVPAAMGKLASEKSMN